ncbi:MAG TPA: ECF RNA polymerase sigma factor SigK [Pedococcus sp.]|jgi:RNA polymerase sigma-70 factor (ECF subfamily)|nr:ECF RNA polymerase sigma factor SigK [Pedococcus sp.]
MSDAQTDLVKLLQCSARGDEAAFAQLYDAVAARVHGLVLRVVRDQAQSEEVTQEVFLDIWRTSSRFDPALGSPIGWILTIAHRKAVDRVRSAQASTNRDEAYGSRNQDRDFDITSETVERRLDAQRVRHALGSLTETQRGAVELAYFGGYTHTEVAGLLGVPLGTAKTRIRDGLIRLRDTLGVNP